MKKHEEISEKKNSQLLKEKRISKNIMYHPAFMKEDKK